MVTNGADQLSESNLEKSMFEQYEKSAVERNRGYAYAMSNYYPKRLGVRVIYFSVDYGGEPWRRICSDLEIVKIEGIHGQFDVADIAKHLRAWLHMLGGEAAISS
jgi:hypothetical protein